MLTWRIRSRPGRANPVRRRRLFVALGVLAFGVLGGAGPATVYLYLEYGFTLFRPSHFPFWLHITLIGALAVAMTLLAVRIHPVARSVWRVVPLAAWSAGWISAGEVLADALPGPADDAESWFLFTMCSFVAAACIGFSCASWRVFAWACAPAMIAGAAMVDRLEEPLGWVFLYGWHPWMALVLGVWSIRARLRVKPDGFCSACGYDLGGLSGGVCPECGEELASKSERG